MPSIYTPPFPPQGVQRLFTRPFQFVPSQSITYQETPKIPPTTIPLQVNVGGTPTNFLVNVAGVPTQLEVNVA